MQLAVALEAVGESGCSLGAEAVVSQTASRGVRVSRHVCQWALAQKQTTPGQRLAKASANAVRGQYCPGLWEHTKGGGALEVRDLRLLEDGSECGGALVSDVVAPETASMGEVGAARDQARQWALTQKRTL